MPVGARILLVDDDPDIIEFLSYSLKREGYEIKEAQNGKIALQAAHEFVPDLILLDVMMPEMDGITTCRELRKDPKLSDTYIIFLTARIEEYSEIAGFAAGADDYITKPIKPGALLSRIQTALKRKRPKEEMTMITLPDLVIDKTSHEVTYKGEKIHLPRKEFELLFILASQPGKVFTREKLLGEIWSNVFVTDRTIDVHVSKIREKLHADCIKTIKGIGYKFEMS